MRIAVVGAGIAGLGSAYLLSRAHEVEVFESEPRAGGHAHSHRVRPAPDGNEVTVDTGFLVYNHRTYPHFVRLLDALGVAGIPSDMSFGVRCRRCGLEYSSRGLRGLFAQAGRLRQLAHWRMLADILRFGRHGREALSAGTAATETLDHFLQRGHYSPGFVHHFLLPMGAAVWSAPASQLRLYPARSFLRFFENHGWLSLMGAPPWWTVRGGSHSYVQAIAQRLDARLHLGSPVTHVRRTEDGVEIRTMSTPEAHRFDAVVLAAHADQSLALLADPSDEERRLLGAFRYSNNRVLLHTDERALPQTRAAWASWNCDLLDCASEDSAVSVTYHLNRLQSLDTPREVFVSLNPVVEPHAPLTTLSYSHPILDAPAVAAQPALAKLSGHRRTFYAGAHMRYGFHEDGLVSAIRVARALGISTW